MTIMAPDQRVRVLWGNENFAIEIGECQMDKAVGFARMWFAENDHYFHLDKFPPFVRVWGTKRIAYVDYGSYAHFLYCIPI